MRKITILPVSGADGNTAYCAVADDKQSVGKTAGEALDALTVQFSEGEADSLVVVQNLKPDRFFNADQQRQISDLMLRWRNARDSGQALSSKEEANLKSLIEAELKASEARAAELSR